MKTEHIIIGSAAILGIVMLTKGKIFKNVGESVGAGSVDLVYGIGKGVYDETQDLLVNPIMEKNKPYWDVRTGKLITPKFYL